MLCQTLNRFRKLCYFKIKNLIYVCKRQKCLPCTTGCHYTWYIKHITPRQDTFKLIYINENQSTSSLSAGESTLSVRCLIEQRWTLTLCSAPQKSSIPLFWHLWHQNGCCWFSKGKMSIMVCQSPLSQQWRKFEGWHFIKQFVSSAAKRAGCVSPTVALSRNWTNMRNYPRCL